MRYKDTGNEEAGSLAPAGFMPCLPLRPCPRHARDAFATPLKLQQPIQSDGWIDAAWVVNPPGEQTVGNRLQ